MPHIRKLAVALYVFLVMTGASAQIDIHRYTSATDTFFWKRYEHIPGPAPLRLSRVGSVPKGNILTALIAQYPEQFAQLSPDSTVAPDIREWKKNLRATDFNDDGKPDIIYAGPGRTTDHMVQLYLFRETGFNLVFEDFGFLTNWTMKEHRLISVGTGEASCAAGATNFLRDYEVKWEGAEPRFIHGKQTAWYRYTELPSLLLEKPVAFESIRDTLTLRASAARINEPFIPEPETFGNIVAKYSKKLRGVVIGTTGHQKNNDWYFVEIIPDAFPSATVLCRHNQIPLFIRGWVPASAILLSGQVPAGK